MSIENPENKKPKGVIIPFEKTKENIEVLLESLPESSKDEARKLIARIIELEERFKKAETREEKELIEAEFTHVYDVIQSLISSY